MLKSLGSTHYSTHIDIWGVGCILFEMLVHKPMFPGSSTDEQLNLIFQKLGTPTMDRYPELCSLPIFKTSTFKKYQYPTSLHTKLSNSSRLTSNIIDLLQKMLQVCLLIYNIKRIYI